MADVNQTDAEEMRKEERVNQSVCESNENQECRKRRESRRNEARKEEEEVFRKGKQEGRKG